MSRRWFARWHRVRVLGISLLILGLAHTPMPQADFHNVRHHDDPGQVCVLHDHLLRWHPDAGMADDVAVLHWHWLMPTAGPDDGAKLGQDAPRIHAHVDDWQGITVDDATQFVADSGSRMIDPPSASPISAFDLAAIASPPDDRGLRAGPMPPLRAYGSTLTAHAPLSCWLARWSC
ncbi:hypothetical protein TA3x_002042 [Tundrisphaera sp. TA3]|uniref:hypothetical protein n=1 Tax=Tundrisphaera sp. TA3 TaxID=3435775 RepID=UPI003EB7C094